MEGISIISDIIFFFIAVFHRYREIVGVVIPLPLFIILTDARTDRVYCFKKAR